MSFLSQLHWRRAEKDFNPNEKVSDANLAKILEAVRFSPSSFGLQPYHIYVVSNQELKDQFYENGWNQPQYKNASHILVFATRTDITTRIDQYLELVANGDADKREKLADLEQMMKGFTTKMSSEQMKAWADRQTYIALGFGLAACAELGIASCPMEGLDPTAFDKILGVPGNEQCVVALAIGYRASEDGHPKVRFSGSDLFNHLT